jgi:phosphate transport system permease protein
MSEFPAQPVIDYSGLKPPGQPAQRFVRDPGPQIGADRVLSLLTSGAAASILIMLMMLVGVLAWAAIPAARTFGFAFITSTDWRPNEIERPKRDAKGYIVRVDDEMVMETIPPSFGALPVIFGTAVSSGLALVLAVPLSLGAAIFLIRIAPHWLVPPVSFLIEFLAAIPSIAYGIWGLFVVCPFIREYLEGPLNRLFLAVPGLGWLGIEGNPTGRDMFAGAVVLAIMIVPIITAISRDVLAAVPRAQIEGSVALGATWWQSCFEMLRYSRSGLFGAVMLGLARAAGETMAVTMVIGNNNQIRSSIFAPAQTMSSLLANEFAEASDGLHRSALVMVALILLVMSLTFNVVARYLVVGKNSRGAAAH